MPEVTEVRRYADFLRDKLQNKNIDDIKILKGRYKTHGPFPLYDNIIKELPLKVIDVQSKGKFMYIILEKDYYIFVTLGLMGGWTFALPNGKYEYAGQNYGLQGQDNALNHLNVEFKVNKGTMFFYDQISQGTLKVIKGKKDLDKKLKTLGPDIMDAYTTFDKFKSCILAKPVNLTKEIGIVLVNQKVISGIGNYLRADVLWMSSISPFRKVNKLSDLELKKIYENARILTWADYDRKEGVKLKIIKKKDKVPSDYDRDFFVYKQDKDINNNDVEVNELYEGKIKRFIYWVPKVQK